MFFKTAADFLGLFMYLTVLGGLPADSSKTS